MNLQIKIEQQAFKVCIGKGYNDWVWLAHYCSRIYSKTIYPQGTYLPTRLYLSNNHTQKTYYPHPRQKIATYLQINNINLAQIECIIRIRKSNHPYNQAQKKWQRQAFESDQYFITFNFSYLAQNFNKKKDFFLKVKTFYTMGEQVKHLYNEKDYPPVIETILADKQIGPNESKFQGTLKIPRGATSHKLYYYERQSIHDQYNQTELSEKKIKKEDFLIREQPIYVSHNQTLQLIEQSMKIQDDINKTLQQKQLQTKKRNASSSLCCFTFQQLWSILESSYSSQLSLGQYEPSSVSRIKITLQKSLTELYQIFFYYFILQNQQKDKKQELGISYQNVIHFLRTYDVISEMDNLSNFLEYYNVDEEKYKKVQDTLNVNENGVRFPQFINILLRSIQFVQTSAFLMKGETFDSAADKIVQKVISIDKDTNELSSFKYNLRENPKIIAFIRNESQKLKRIYSWMCHKSIQFSSSSSLDSFIIMKQQFKQLLIQFSLVDRSIDQLINQCWRQLKFSQEGIVYYEYLMAMQWIALATIDEQQKKDLQDDEEKDQQKTILIIEKIKSLIEKIAIQ